MNQFTQACNFSSLRHKQEVNADQKTSTLPVSRIYSSSIVINRARNIHWNII